MNGLAVIFLLLSCGALLTLPRRWAPLPLLAGACYMTLGQGIQVGPFHFPIVRMLLFVGVMRVLCRRERLVAGFNRLDWLILAWGASAICISVQPLVGQLGLVYNALGIYFLVRIFCQSVEDMVCLTKILAFVLVPVAIEMINEHVTGHDLFALFGGVADAVEVREGRLRAQGPFSHSILAGGVGAACFPFMIGIWRRDPLAAKVGLAACLVMVVACSSSGPLVGLMAGTFALAVWRWRHLTRQMRIAAVAGYLLLDLVMKAPPYYLIARIDLAGGSTGWHRAELIYQAIQHLNEWWLAGTTYTRHWMPYGVSWSEDHCDITNQYISYGVVGGLPLMFLFIAVLWTAFRYVGNFLRLHADDNPADLKFVWALGAALFAQAASCLSVAYFDQSFIFLYANIAVIGSLQALALQPSRAAEPLDFAPARLPGLPGMEGTLGG
jgi:hypothetical protein